MIQSSRPVSESLAPLSRWARFWDWCWGWFSPSPPASLPEVSATLVQDDEPESVMPEHIVQAIMGLGEIASSVEAGHIRAFVIFMQTPEGVSRMWFNGGGHDPESLSVEIMRHGSSMLKQASRSQGTAPPENRSVRNQ